MIKNISNLFLSTSLALLFHQLPVLGQEHHLIHGEIFSQKDHQPIPFVNIIVQNKNVGGASDIEGRFIIKVGIQDTLIFSAVGYKKTSFTITEKMIQLGVLEVNMQQDSLVLENVNVYSNGNQPRVFRKINEPYYIPGIGMERKPPKKPELQKPKDPTIANYALGMVFNPISTLHSIISKKEKEELKMRHILYDEAIAKKKQKRREKFAGILTVSKIFDIDTLKAKRFLEYYSPSDSIILNHGQAEVTIDLMEHYGEYLEYLKNEPREITEEN